MKNLQMKIKFKRLSGKYNMFYKDFE